MHFSYILVYFSIQSQVLNIFSCMFILHNSCPYFGA